MNFASENYDGAHPLFLESIARANTGFTPSYGNDEYTQQAVALLKSEFGEAIEVYLTFNGTGANNFGLSCIAQRHESILCSDIAHLYVDEATAPEAFIGSRLYPIPSENGKLTVEALEQYQLRKNDVHHPQAKVVTLTQPTEYGTVYSITELKAIKDFCNRHQLLLHIDGARFFNAAAALNVSLKEISTDVGIDVLTLGGTKMGMLFGEAVIIFHPSPNNAHRYLHKRSMQLASKNRFIATQFHQLLNNQFWQELAYYGNKLAKQFEVELNAIPQLKLAYPVETNAVFLKMPKWLYIKLQQHANFYYWNEQKEEARLVFSFNNTEEEIIEFVYWLKIYLDEHQIELS